jgi:Flp pilus assembly protein TadD
MKYISILSSLLIAQCKTPHLTTPAGNLDLKPLPPPYASSPVTDWHQFFLPQKKEAPKVQANIPKADATIASGKQALQAGQWQLASQHLTDASQLDQNNHEIFLELANISVKFSHLDQAMIYLEKAKNLLLKQETVAPLEVLRYRYILALLRYEQGDLESSRTILSDLISIDPTFSPGYSALASTYIKQGQYAAASFIIDRGMERCRADANLWHLKGVLAEKLLNPHDARDWYNRVVKLQPDFVPTLVNRAMLAIGEQKFNEAIKDLQKALSLQPEDASVLVALGTLHARMGQMEQARRAFEETLKQKPFSIMARYNLALIYMNHLKEPQKALQLFHEIGQTGGGHEEPALKQAALDYIADIKHNLDKF